MKIIWFFIALAIAALFAVYMISLMPEKEVEQKIVYIPTKEVIEKEVKTVDVLVATRDIGIGQELKHGVNVGTAVWPENKVHSSFIQIKDSKSIDGIVEKMITRAPFYKGENILMSKLQNIGDPSFLPGLLEPGMRAVTIRVDNISSVAGFVKPGDYVDVMLIYSVDVSESNPDVAAILEGAELPLKNGNSATFSELMLQNVKVLAVDQSATLDTAQGKKGNKIPNTMTLELSVSDAQRVRLAERFGQISLVLRGLKEEEGETVTRPSSLSDLSRIFPPSYFSTLFDNNSKYDIPVVDIFADQGENGESINPIEAIYGDDKVEDDEEADTRTITVFRGTSKEELEFEVEEGDEQEEAGDAR